jgi:signal peptidase I
MAQSSIGMGLKMVPVPEGPSPHYTGGKRPRKPRHFGVLWFVRQVAIVALVAVLSVGCYFGVSHYFVETVEVVGRSMMPTLKENNFYILNRMAFHSHTPKRGDIVVLRDPEDHGISVKRVIAVEGESVHFRNGRVYVDGEELKEPYLTPSMRTYTSSGAFEQIIMCGKDQVYVMGDNRVASVDSRAYGPVPRENIMGQLVMR